MTIKYLKIEFQSVEELREYVKATQNIESAKAAIVGAAPVPAIVPKSEIPPQNGWKKYVWKFKWRAWTQDEDSQVKYAYNNMVNRNGRMPQGTISNLARKLKRTPAAVTARAEVLRLTAKYRNRR